jgi:lipopolysaccharide export system protein LptA
MPTIANTLGAAVIAAVALVGAAAVAQQGPPNALQGFSANRDRPVKIQAASLEVRDKDKVATFSGDVHVVQGDTEMRCKTLMVFYEEGMAKGGAKVAQSGPGGGQIRRMEAKGGVVVTQKDQIATGDSGVFDMRTNTVTLSGKVVVTKGQDVLKGEKLVVNLTDGVSKMDSGGGRVEMMMAPREEKSGQAQSKGQGQGSSQTKSARPARTN